MENQIVELLDENEQSSKLLGRRLTWEEKKNMTVDEQVAYMQLHWKEIQERVKAVDEALEQCEMIEMTDEEIAEMVSKDRREHYEASLHH